MDFRTIVDVPRPGFEIGPQERILCVGSCFADSIGRRFLEEKVNKGVCCNLSDKPAKDHMFKERNA